MRQTKEYKEHLLQSLEDPKEAAAYLDACLEDEDPHVFLLALKDVAEARGGIGQLSKRSSLNRQSLPRILFMMSTNVQLAEQLLNDPFWRLNHLYWIIDKVGNKELFKLNRAQEKLYHEMWYCNLILKARQLGISTFVCLLFLDRCLFNNIFNRCWFDEVKCGLGIKALENYKKEWNDRHGCWSSRPLHNFASHGADAFRMLAVGISKLASQGLSSAEWKRLRLEYIV